MTESTEHVHVCISEILLFVPKKGFNTVNCIQFIVAKHFVTILDFKNCVMIFSNLLMLLTPLEFAR